MAYLLLGKMILQSALKKIAVKVVSANASNHLNNSEKALIVL